MATQEELLRVAGEAVPEGEGSQTAPALETPAAQAAPRRGPGRPPGPAKTKPVRSAGGRFAGSVPAGSAVPARVEKIEWKAGAPYLSDLAGPIYDGLGVPRPELAKWEAFCGAWGAVLDKYVPDLGGYKEEAAAVLCTIAVGGPLFLAWRARTAARPRVVGVPTDGKSATAETGDRPGSASQGPTREGLGNPLTGAS